MLTRILSEQQLPTLSPQEFFPTIGQTYLEDEEVALQRLQTSLEIDADMAQKIRDEAYSVIHDIRSKPDIESSLDALLREYNLSTKEGLVLMCLAEAYLRIPDKASADAFIRDKIAGINWKSHKGNSDKSLVNFATWGLILTGSIMDVNETSGIFKKMTNKLSEPIIRQAVYQAMKVMGKQFVLGETIEEALKNGRKIREAGYTYTFDMLGEAAMTEQDAARYFEDYKAALIAVGKESPLPKSPKPSLSIKLSALHARYNVANKDLIMTELYDRVKELALLGAQIDAEISIDAEEADRLELSLELFEKLLEIEEIRNWGGLGLVIQGYAKHALPALIWTTLLAKSHNTTIPVRLVKGAYWDTEIKDSQVRGLNNFPVFTRKENTDISYLACAKYMLSPMAQGAIKPQFATHNAQTVTSILNFAAKINNDQFEFQRLHGMGEALYNEIIAKSGKSVRIYAPVGKHHDLLPYLVRRLLENGANSSFVHQLVDPEVEIDSLVESPSTLLEQYGSIKNPAVIYSDHLYKSHQNSRGLNTNISSTWEPFAKDYHEFLKKTWSAAPLINGKAQTNGNTAIEALSPTDLKTVVGKVSTATPEQVETAISSLQDAWFNWNLHGFKNRAIIFERMADLLEENRAELIALCSLEAGKTIQDGIDEIREAADFCRYYASEARKYDTETIFASATGERNSFHYSGKGVIACISPWNFPLAIFLGQITAALVSGNTVLAKPAEATPLIAYRTVELLFEAGLPADAIALLPGDGKVLGDIFTKDHRVVGVCFTGSTATAKHINLNLAQRDGAIPMLIAETGGQNVMFVDSTALPEQVVRDTLQSAFVSAGQRCSALRVLYLQEEIADRIIELLKGALEDYVVGLPFSRKTDVSTVIDERAKQGLQAHIDELTAAGKLLAQAPLDPNLTGYFIAPSVFEIDSIKDLNKENFGPILHIVRYNRRDLASLIKEVNATGFGLTMGIHTRNDTVVDEILTLARVGNFYVNRNQVGAVVGVQPFGGLGLSGTGPKAGGPNYLLRFMNEHSVSINTAAIGGDAALISQAYQEESLD
ncbi:bifunctional proline dehydrogenase/L-glutamate gamma-semialdehyde dehydrogenase PutA [Ignatzschineria rhizosphaerae]|uniref:Bifunctional protein PutA n=1 Tax=Ignatzschineria rhizosphaerae TaxID=2923279 RepID=A0ABY3X940_9GAMM|nr:bifunctional proline dehydrogenase/L-glutamate gamma-semialdehyde dehydrogenase PutA [Ignatzschineria rhizosphaerae]UNM97231.1 bifunctional proline dehydrogenase/L-glutamate gamma-semialdehyde dehydrogenase PutA [Ignatzschineria rhizosphaerae]